ncbi:MAG: GTP-binding protein [Spirochaetales bacterium]|nr:GTP-binding protein [Spirochaetales bacterium]
MISHKTKNLAGKFRKSESTILIALVGNPNVGKSVIFNLLTGSRVTVSNYPGTTVNISRGNARIQDSVFEIVDTPGMYSLLPITEEEQVARDILLDDLPGLVINVLDARNLERMLALTTQLIEAGLDIVVVLNMIDEATAAGMEIDHKHLEELLGVTVIPMVGITGQGIMELEEAVHAFASKSEAIG